MNDSKTSGREAQGTGQTIGKLADLYGVGAVRYDGRSPSFEDGSRVTLECDEVTFLTDCARIRLKGDDLSRLIGGARRIVVNGTSFVREGGPGGGE